MFITLSVECSTPFPSVALVGDKTLLAESHWQTARGDCGRLLAEIQKVMQTHHIGFESISLFAVGLGPGGFTALRASVAAIQALALPSKTPVVGVCSADAVAADISDAEPIMIVGDARRDRLWTAAYPRREPTVLQTPVELVPITDIVPHMQQPGLIVGSPDWARLQVVLDQIVPASVTLLREDRIPQAATIGRLALQRFLSNGLPSIPIDVIYVHPPVFIEPRFTESAKRPLPPPR